jgi:hypothetical protein
MRRFPPRCTSADRRFPPQYTTHPADLAPTADAHPDAPTLSAASHHPMTLNQTNLVSIPNLKSPGSIV